MTKQQSAAVILLGGSGHRLGPDKGLIRIGGQPIIQRIIETIRPLVTEIIGVGEVAGLPEALQLPVVGDEVMGCGPLGGIYTGLRRVSAPYCFVVAWDMPFVHPGLVAHQLSLAPEADVVVPRRGEYVEPLHAVYAQTCLPLIEEHLAAGDYKVASIFARLRVKYVEADQINRFGTAEQLFFNVNNQEDLQEAQHLADERGQ